MPILDEILSGAVETILEQVLTPVFYAIGRVAICVPSMGYFRCDEPKTKVMRHQVRFCGLLRSKGYPTHFTVNGVLLVGQLCCLLMLIVVLVGVIYVTNPSPTG